MGVDAQPLPPAAENRTDPDCHPDAAAVDRLRGVFQSKASAERTPVPEPLQVHPLSGGCLPAGARALYPLEPAAGENRNRPERIRRLRLRRTQRADGPVSSRLAGYRLCIE